MTAPALLDFAARIVAAHSAATGALRDAVVHAVEAGELLAQAKASIPHGSFGSFCAGLPFSETTARGYMRLARLDPANRQRVADMPLRAALLELAEPRPVQAAPLPAANEIVIPLGSVGIVEWMGPRSQPRVFEVHPVLWPDGVNLGLQYAYMESLGLDAGALLEHSRRPVSASTIGVRELAGMYGAPLDALRVFVGSPVLWRQSPEGQS